MTKFDKCTKLFSTNKVTSKIVSTRIIVSTWQLTLHIKQTITSKKKSKLGVVYKFDLIVQSSSDLVIWFDCRILAVVRIFQIPTISLLD